MGAMSEAGIRNEWDKQSGPYVPRGGGEESSPAPRVPVGRVEQGTVRIERPVLNCDGDLPDALADVRSSVEVDNALASDGAGPGSTARFPARVFGKLPVRAHAIKSPSTHQPRSLQAHEG